MDVETPTLPDLEYTRSSILGIECASGYAFSNASVDSYTCGDTLDSRVNTYSEFSSMGDESSFGHELGRFPIGFAVQNEAESEFRE